MILCVILLQVHPLTPLYDPFGSCYDKVPSVAGGEAAAAKPLGGGLGSPLAELSFHGAIISETLLPGKSY